MDKEKRFYAVVVVVRASSKEEAKAASGKYDGATFVGDPWPIEPNNHTREHKFDTVRAIDQHPEADF